MTVRVCARCHAQHALSQFYQSPKGWLDSYCRGCRAAYNLEYAQRPAVKDQRNRDQRLAAAEDRAGRRRQARRYRQKPRAKVLARRRRLMWTLRQSWDADETSRLAVELARCEAELARHPAPRTNSGRPIASVRPEYSVQQPADPVPLG